MPMLRTERDARGIATLILDRPAQRNALSAELVTTLTNTLGTLAADAAVRIVLLKGAGDVFCAGADIGEMRAAGAAAQEANEADSRRFAALLDRLEAQPQPTVAVVHGAAYGGAIGLISACDIAIAAGSARFALSEVRLGLIPAMISPYVIRAIGLRQARRLQQSSPVTCRWARSIAPASSFGSTFRSVGERCYTDIERQAIGRLTEAHLLHSATVLQARLQEEAGAWKRLPHGTGGGDGPSGNHDADDSDTHPMIP
jgi:enoyl-CoA hydratase/carnithine racemase